MENKEYITTSAEETQNLSLEFCKRLNPSDTVCLYGGLGSGKTTFVKGLAMGLGINSRINSPTFIIVRSYELKSQSAKRKAINTLYHLDLYRLEIQEEVENIGLSEILEDKNGIVLIEWAEKAGKLLPKTRWDVRFEYIDYDKRKIIFKKYD